MNNKTIIEFGFRIIWRIRLIQQQNGNVSWRRRAQVELLGWPMAVRQIGHRKSSLVPSARFPVVKWRSRSVAKSAYYGDLGGCPPRPLIIILLLTIFIIFVITVTAHV